MKKQIKLSSLSEGLRKEVNKHLKEGRAKLSQMPESIRKRIISEMSISEEGGEIKKLISYGEDDNGNALFKDALASTFYVMMDGQLYEAADDVYFEPMYKVHFPYEIISDEDHVDDHEYGEDFGHDPSDDFIDSNPWEHGPDNDMYGESKQTKMKNKQIKLSSLSEGLRKEVKKHLKEGRTKMNIRSLIRRIILESTQGLKKISTHEALDKGMFGPVYHGSSQSNQERIEQDGFKFIVGNVGDDGISHGYQQSNYANGLPAPIHHLGFGVYFTTVRNIAKGFNHGSTKGLKPFFLDVHNIKTINFGSQSNMMKWWVENGYDPDLAKQGDQGRVEATKKLSQNLSSQYDAVWFKGKGLNRLLDGDQIVVFDTSRIYRVDDSSVKGKVVGAKVMASMDIYKPTSSDKVALQIPKGTKGIVVSKDTRSPESIMDNIKRMGQEFEQRSKTEGMDPDFYRYWSGQFERMSSGMDSFSVKFAKGGTIIGVFDDMLEALS